MTREEAIAYGKRVIDLGFKDEVAEFCEMAIKALSESKGEWIPVSERLPLLIDTYKISDDVLITNGYEIDMGYIVERTGKICWHYYGSEWEVGVKDEDNDATAWMPLPEPYKVESEEYEMRKCSICGRRFRLLAKNRYEVVRTPFGLTCLTHGTVYYNAFNCPHCGCQNIVGVLEKVNVRDIEDQAQESDEE